MGIFKSVTKLLKKAAPVIGGTIGFAIGGPMGSAALGSALGAGIGSLVGGADTDDALKAALLGGIGGYAASGGKFFTPTTGGAGVTGSAANITGSEIVDPKKINSNKVVFSAQVELFDFEKDSAITYTIVGDDEADIKSGLISINSPIARALIGKEKGDIVSAETPSGQKEFEILKILYG